MNTVENKKRLEDALRARGLEYRDDSKLCREYSLWGDRFEFSLDNIVDIMEEMDFLYKKSDYREILGTDLKARSAVTGKRVDDDEHEEIREAAKLKAYRKYKIDHPDYSSLPANIIRNIENA